MGETANASITNLEELRFLRREEANARGKTLEEELDEFEASIGSRAYVNCLRLLFGVDEKPL